MKSWKFGRFWCQKCAVCCFQKNKQKPQNLPTWPKFLDCEAIQVCQHLVKTCSSKCSCRWAFSIFPPDPRRGHSSSHTLKLQERRQQVLLRVSFQENRSQYVSQPWGFGWVLGWSWVCHASVGRVQPLVQRLCWSCVVLQYLHPVPQTFPQRYSCSYHPASAATFCTFLNYIDYHIKHSWC